MEILGFQDTKDRLENQETTHTRVHKETLDILDQMAPLVFLALMDFRA